MSKTKDDLIQFRLEKAEEALETAKFAIGREFWSTAASELYYACYYLVTALFAKYELDTSTHAGVKSQFSLKFIKEQKIDMKWGKLLAVLFDKRQKGDYGDFMTLTEEEVEPYFNEVREFKIVIQQMLQD